MRKGLWLIVIVAGLAGGGGIYRALRASDPGLRILTAPVTRGDIVQSVTATGTLEAVTTVQVGTQVSGIIQTLNADFNSLVHKGEVIARLDPSLFRTQVEQAQANLVKSQADVDRLRVALKDAQTQQARAKELSAKALLPQSDLDAANVAVLTAEANLKSSEAQVRQAQAALDQSQVSLEHTVIQSPIDGIVVSRNVDVGQTVAASLSSPTLFVIAADLTKMRVNASIDESDIGRMQPGQPVHFEVDAYPGESFSGTVAQVRLEPITTQNVVTYTTVIDVPNPESKLKPGMTATVTVETARRNDVLRVPLSAVRFKPTAEVFAALGEAVPPEIGDRAEGAAGRAEGADSARVPRPMATSGAESPTGFPAAARAAGTRPNGGAPGHAELWIYRNGRLDPVRVRLGLADPTNVEIAGGDVSPGTQVATAVASATMAGAGDRRPSGSPLMPSRPGRPR